MIYIYTTRTSSIIMHQSGMVNNESSVDKKTHFTAKCASPSYLDARMAVVVPAGIPDRDCCDEWVQVKDKADSQYQCRKYNQTDETIIEIHF